MFLEDKKFFDSGDDELIREFLLEADNSINGATSKVASYWDIYQNKKAPRELREYIRKIAKDVPQAQIDEEISKLKEAGLDFLH